MATSKTLTPTNQTVSIPAMADVPDMSVVATTLDKMVDAVNKNGNAERPIVKTITATSQTDFDSQLATECESLSYGHFEFIELLGNWSGTSPTNGARSIAILHRLNLTGSYYMCYIQFTNTTGYYYSGAWHWTAYAQVAQIASDWTGCADYKETIESGGNAVLQSFGKLRTLTFQGVSRSHTEDEVLMTLPSSHRPIGGNNIFASGVVNGTPILIRLNGSNGQVALFLANGAGTGRIYFNMTWVAA